MARKHDFSKTRYANIFSLLTATGDTEYYTTFKLNGKQYRNKNLTRLYNATTAKQAKDKLEEIKSLLRQGINPFENMKDTVHEIILEDIENKKSKVPGKDNSKYIQSLKSFYNLYVDDIIGHLRFDRVTPEHVSRIMRNLEGKSASFKKNMRVLMNERFEDALRKGKIQINPFYGIDYGEDKGKPALDIRFNEPITNVSQKLYHAALVYNEKYRLLLILSIMLARRIGEIHKLTYGHVKQTSDGDWYILATEEITKTGIDEKYPLPVEAIALLPDDINDRKKHAFPLFEFCYSGMFAHEHKLVKNADIDIHKGYKLTSHDHRNLFVSVLSESGVDSNLADRCLSHGKKTMLNTYLDVGYEKRKEIFGKYWEILRAKPFQPT